MNQTLYYSLTGRGLYSELMNLILAKIYCEENNINLVVNTRNWNSKYENGWEDYFLKTFITTNSFMSAQYYVDGCNHKIGLGNLLKKPLIEIAHLNQCILNYLFKLKTGSDLSDDIFFKMRSKEFISSIGDNIKWQILLNNALSQVYKYNSTLLADMLQSKKLIGIQDKKYIGVHIRRGDKVTTKEMENVILDKYINAIKEKKNLSYNVYIATDDIGIVDKIKTELSDEYNIFYNIFISSVGFDETKYNKKSKFNRYNEAKLAILDVDILLNSVYFIGTYSSNLSRIIPCFKGFDSCESLDIDWSPVF